jgi:hypothetical protein
MTHADNLRQCRIWDGALVGSAYINANVTVAGRGGSASARKVAYEIACFATVIGCAALIVWLVALPMLGHIPEQNALYSADTGRVYAYLDGKTEGYFRMKVHPLYGWLCIFYQYVVMRQWNIPDWIAIPALSGIIAVACAGLLYVAMRRLGVAALTAVSFTLLFCASATFVFWSTLPETHMLAGATVVAAVLVMTAPGRSGGNDVKSVIALVIGFSTVVTDGMIWVLRQIDFTPIWRGGWGEFFRLNRSRLREVIGAAALGVGLTYLLWLPEWPLLHKRVGIPFNFLEERNFVELEPANSMLSIQIFGLTPPHIGLDWLVPVLCIVVTAASLLVLRPRLWFIPLFALFGLCLHSVYSGDSAFLFSPDYMPMFILTLALVAKERLPRWLPVIVLPLALLLLTVNLEQWNTQMQALAAAGGVKTFATVTLH